MPNAYQRRVALRKAKYQFKVVGIEGADRILREFERSYQDLYGKMPKVSYYHGWYYLPCGKFQRSRVLVMVRVMQARYQEVSSNYEPYQE